MKFDRKKIFGFILVLMISLPGCNTPLVDAIKNGDLKLVKKIIETENIDLNKIHSSGWTPLMYAVCYNNPDIVKQVVVKRTEYPTPLHGYRRQREAIAGHNTYDRLPEIKTPTLVIAGDADKLVPVENSRILADRIPDAELVLLENMGHGFSIEAADEFHKTVIDFLKRHPRSG